MIFVQCLGFFQKDTMESSLRRETLDRSPESYEAVGNHAMAMVAGNRPPASMQSRAQGQDEAPGLVTEYSTTLWLDPVPRARLRVSLRCTAVPTEGYWTGQNVDMTP